MLHRGAVQTRGCPDRGYRSLRSLNPRLNSCTALPVQRKPCGISPDLNDPCTVLLIYAACEGQSFSGRFCARFGL